MALHADQDLGLHQGRRRMLELGSDEFGFSNSNIAAGAFVDTNELYAPGFSHFAGELSVDTPIATTLSIQILPRIAGSLGGGGGGAILASAFVVATITTLAGLFRYHFFWGEARGLLTGATGATHCFSPIFRIRIRNTGVQPANTTNIEAVVCQ